MKRNILLITCTVLALNFAGCASDKGGATTGSSEKPKPAQKQAQKDPEVGMTKEQVIAQYGKTDDVSVSSDGEVWTYNLNMGEAFIPFNFGYRPKFRVIMFNKDGKVTHWNYTK